MISASSLGDDVICCCEWRMRLVHLWKLGIFFVLNMKLMF